MKANWASFVAFVASASTHARTNDAAFRRRLRQWGVEVLDGEWIGLTCKSTGNHRFSHESWGFPVEFPLNQSIDGFWSSEFQQSWALEESAVQGLEIRLEFCVPKHWVARNASYYVQELSANIQQTMENKCKFQDTCHVKFIHPLPQDPFCKPHEISMKSQ